MKTIVQITASSQKITNNCKQKEPCMMSQDLFHHHLSSKQLKNEQFKTLVQAIGTGQKHFNGHSMLIKRWKSE